MHSGLDSGMKKWESDKICSLMNKCAKTSVLVLTIM